MIQNLYFGSQDINVGSGFIIISMFRNTARLIRVKINQCGD